MIRFSVKESHRIAVDSNIIFNTALSLRIKPSDVYFFNIQQIFIKHIFNAKHT